MNEKAKKTIKETLQYLLSLRYDFILGDSDADMESKAIYVRNNLMTTHSDGTMIFLERFITGDNVEKIKKLDNQLVNLNLLLPYLERNKEVIAIDQEMKKIQAKNNITVKEFAEIYNISTSSQRDYRSRLQDALPYHQKVSGGKIIYVVEEVEIWFENQHR